MAAYNHEDQDSIDGIKTWWDKFGTAITVVLTALLVAMAAHKPGNIINSNRHSGSRFICFVAGSIIQ